MGKHEAPEYKWYECPNCMGKGEVRQWFRNKRGIRVPAKVLCTRCNGRKQVLLRVEE